MPFRIVVVLGFVIFLAVCALVRPYLGVLFMIVWIIARPQDDRPNVGQLHVPLVLSLTAIVSTVLRFSTLSKFATVRVMRVWAIGIYFVLIWLSATVNPTYFSDRAVGWFQPIIVTCILIMLWVNSIPKIAGLMGGLLLGALYVSREAISRPHMMEENIASESFKRLDITRLNANFGNPNLLALLMAIGIIIALAGFTAKSPFWMKIPLAACVVPFLIVFMRANSRGASLGLVAGLMVLWLFHKNRLPMTLVIISFGVAAAFFAPAEYIARLKFISNYSVDSSATARAWNSGKSE